MGNILLAFARSGDPGRHRSVLFGQHDRNHALGDRRIGRVWRVIAARVIETIDLKKYRVAIDLNSRIVPMTPIGSVTMTQVRRAISPARKPALADSRTMTLLRNGCRLVSAKNTFLPELKTWLGKHDYPFEFTTEASLTWPTMRISSS